ncbi:MAG: UDP-3-O-(3-hydroxymyristoyl)glucosamine N-acyltransferase [Deltaproteobacteria bacterium]|jgi:UDP-3-O-[3-hydroxymyristoyl] glucosamine N-acyltransferase|nr:UDP-3-O-(3-hydroxymyristoyl)glucosamine N-acyltransferase [Deltaproteobacteria bacterium]
MKTKTLGELAEHVGGKVVGDPNIVITAAATLEDAHGGEISFLANPKYRKHLKSTKASAVVVKQVSASNSALLVVDDPYYAFTQIVILMYGHRRHKPMGLNANASIASTANIGEKTDVHEFAVIADHVQVGRRCVIYPGVYIGEGSVIGDDCILYPNVVVYDGCQIGNRVIMHANATIGEDGFGFATHKGTHYKIPHIGQVVVEDDVEIGASAAIERGTFSNTVIGEGTKIGDSVVVGHGTVIGPHCLFVPQVGIAGSTTIGSHCVAAGQVGISGHIKIGNRVTMGAQSGVISNLADDSVVFGTPAFNFADAKRAFLALRTLPELQKKIAVLEAKLSKKETKT